MACRNGGSPGPGGYWFSPPRIASTACSSIALGPSVSGKPWPRLTAAVCCASAVISAKMVVPNPRIRSTSGSDNGLPMASSAAPGLSEQGARHPVHPTGRQDRHGGLHTGIDSHEVSPLRPSRGQRVLDDLGALVGGDGVPLGQSGGLAGPVHLLGVAHALAVVESLELFVGELVALAPQRSGDRPRLEERDVDAVRSKLQPQRVTPGTYGELRRAVRRDERRREPAADRTDVDNPAAVGEQLRKQHLGDGEMAKKFARELPPPVVELEGLARAAHRVAGVVDETHEPAL